MGLRKKMATESPTVRYVRLTYASEKAVAPTTPRTAQRCHNERSPAKVSTVNARTLSSSSGVHGDAAESAGIEPEAPAAVAAPSPPPTPRARLLAMTLRLCARWY